MFPCCHLCYAKYVRADGTVDAELFAEARDAWKEKAKDRHTPEGLQQISERKPCTCECHKIGANVLH